MKKTLLSLAALLLISASGIYAQSFKIIDQAGNLLNNLAITVSGSEMIMYPGDEPIKSRAYVVNLTPNSVTMNVHRFLINVPGTVTEQFCFGPVCNAPGTFQSPSSETTITGNDTNTTFYGDIFPNGNIGSYQIRYVFFNVNNPSDSVYLDVTFNAGTNGVDKNLAKPTISTAYPNPAKDYTSLEYNLNSASQGKIIITDMAGNQVAEKVLNEAEGTAKLDLTDLTNGVYFYTFYANGKAISTKRLVISK